ncbi:hypothetical protein D3C79_1042290 [compost metagenome]
MIRGFTGEHADPLLLQAAQLRLIVRGRQVITELRQLRQIFFDHGAEFHPDLIVPCPQQPLNVHRPRPEHVIR